MSQNNNRSFTQVAADLAKKAKALIRIIRGALRGGLKGAAVAAVKEALPFLVKLAIGLIIASVVIPMFVFSVLPNMFFGFENSPDEEQITMRTQALTVGGAYMSLETFEQTYRDSVVTSILGGYQDAGTEIDNVDITSKFDEEDLCWFIAINSVANQQDLSVMRAEDIQAMCISSLKYSTNVTTSLVAEKTLKINFKSLDPEQLMEYLGFDEDAKTWAGAIYEVLYESDALTEYADHFEAYKPSYSGDTSYDGSYESGGGGTGGSGGGVPGSGNSTEIDISGFTDPDTKNNLDLAAYAIQAWENGWGYVWGTFGHVLTESVLDYKIEQYPDIASAEEFIRDNWLNRRTTDCVGLIKSYGWFDPNTMSINYGTNGMPDYNADSMYAAAEANETDYGDMDEMPEIIGLALWKPGHIGIYIGNGYAIEAMGTYYGVVKTEVAGRGWSGWCKIPYIEYYE